MTTPKIISTVKQHDTLYASVDYGSMYDTTKQPPVNNVTYQWYRNSESIPGATDSTYTLTQADVNKNIQVVTNDSLVGNGDWSESIYAVNVNDAPQGKVTISSSVSNVYAGTELTANTSTLTDEDGLGLLNYQWLRDGVAISSAKLSTYKLTSADHGKNISVNVSYIDGFGAKESVTSDTSLVNLNSKATGDISISGTSTVGSTLKVVSTLKDADGLGTFSYQWFRDGAAIDNATNSKYKLVAADLNKSIYAKVTYTDGANITSTVTTKAAVDVYSANADKVYSTALIDKLTGGKGADTFVFSSITSNVSLLDTITDFSTKQGDKIDLSGIDANASVASDQAFSLVTGAFTAAGQLRFDAATHTLYGNTDNTVTNGVDAPEFAVVLTGVNSVAATDFVL